jgi:hypothetical protein
MTLKISVMLHHSARHLLLLYGLLDIIVSVKRQSVTSVRLSVCLCVCVCVCV